LDQRHRADGKIAYPIVALKEWIAVAASPAVVSTGAAA
jgi:hypothetical protein